MRFCSAPALRIALAALLALGAVAAPLRADDAWSALSADERSMLAPFAQEWSGYDEPMRARLRVLSHRWADLPAPRRAREMERFRRWQSLPPDQREELRDRHRAFQQLDDSERARVRDQYQRWQQLSPRERRALRASIGPERAGRQAVMRKLDADTRQELRAAVAQLDPAARRQLQRHLRAIGVDAAAATLRDFVAQPAATRAQWVERLPRDDQMR